MTIVVKVAKQGWDNFVNTCVHNRIAINYKAESVYSVFFLHLYFKIQQDRTCCTKSSFSQIKAFKTETPPCTSRSRLSWNHQVLGCERGPRDSSSFSRGSNSQMLRVRDSHNHGLWGSFSFYRGRSSPGHWGTLSLLRNSFRCNRSSISQGFGNSFSFKRKTGFSVYREQA